MTKEQLYKIIKENGARYAEEEVFCGSCPLRGSCELQDDSCEELLTKFYDTYKEETCYKKEKIISKFIIPDNTPLMLNDKVVGMVIDGEVDAAGYYTCKIAKECISANVIAREDNSYMVHSFLLESDDKRRDLG